MAYYKITLDQSTEEQRSQLLEALSTGLNLPIETSGEWRSDRDEPFLQLINEYLYIRHIRRLSRAQKLVLVANAEAIVNQSGLRIEPFQDDVEQLTVVVPNKVGSLTFKFFH
jgi:hypothetical protein